MQSIRVAAFVFTVMLSLGVINSFGIMEPHPVPQATGFSASQLNDNLNKTMSSGTGDDISNAVYGWSGFIMWIKTLWGFITGPEQVSGFLINQCQANQYVAAELGACLLIIIGLGAYQIFTKYGLGWTNL